MIYLLNLETESDSLTEVAEQIKIPVTVLRYLDELNIFLKLILD